MGTEIVPSVVAGPRRIRVVFSSETGCIPRSNASLTQRWALIPAELKVVGDLAHHLGRQVAKRGSRRVTTGDRGDLISFFNCIA